MLLLFLLLPLLAILIVNLSFRNVMRKLALWLGILLSVGQILVVLFHPACFWDRIGLGGHFFTPALQADTLSLVLLFSIGLVVFTAVLVGWQTITEPRQWLNFINLVLIALIGMNGTVLLSDLFSLYVFLEITAISSFILIALQRDLNALEGAFKYIILSAVATVLMLSSIALLLLVSGDTSFATISDSIRNLRSSIPVKFAIGIFICGLFIKGGLVPFHGWVPGAYSAAPAAVSALLAGVVTKVSGIYTLIRLVTSVFGPNDSVNSILMIAGAISILAGALAALGQNDFKRMLAYSSISQVGYIVLGLGCGSPLGVVGAVFHLFNHAVFKTLLFVNSAAVEQRLGTTDMNRMGGLGARMPFTSVTSLIGFLSAAGVPPTSGFWSKLIILVALWQSHHYIYAFIAILASVVTLAYLLSMQRKVFFGILSEKLQDIREASYGIVLPAVVLAVITIGVGLLFPVVFNSVVMPIGSVLK